MRSVNLYQFFQIGSVIHPLVSAEEGQSIGVILYDLFSARNWLGYLLANNIVPLSVAWASGQALLELLNTIIAQGTAPKVQGSIEPIAPDEEPVEQVLSWDQAYNLRTRTQTFETVLSAELQGLDTYFVSQKGIYSTPDLIDAAERALEDDIRAALSKETLQDFQQAGRCLALELPTASGFHVMRATEAVLRQWHDLEITTPQAGFVNWNKCVENLKTAKADLNTLAILDQIRALHRNPLMHPEDFLTVPQSLRLFDIAKSAIVAMAEQIIEKKAAGQLTLPALVTNSAVP